MRLTLALILTGSVAAPALAWEFSDTPVCTLSHQTPEVAVTVTFDPILPEYTITLTLTDAPWPVAPVFAMAFDGPAPLVIQTERHVLSDGGQSLSVTDTGFGNVLDGLEFNAAAMAFAGDRRVAISLAEAAAAVQAFRDCPSVTTS